MSETITLMSHPGSRARAGYEATLPVRSLSAVTPMFDIIWRHGDDMSEETERWMRDGDGTIVIASPLDDVLDDVVYDENTVLFDGLLPDDSGCRTLRPSLIRDETGLHYLSPQRCTDVCIDIEARQGDFGTIGYLPDYGVPAVRTDADSFHGRAGAFGFSVDEGRVHFDGADAKSERGHALMLRSKHHLVVHDDRWTDRRRFLKDRLGEVRGALNSHALKLEKTATDLRTVLAGKRTEVFPHVDQQGINTAVLQLTNLRLALDALEEN